MIDLDLISPDLIGDALNGARRGGPAQAIHRPDNGLPARKHVPWLLRRPSRAKGALSCSSPFSRASPLEPCLLRARLAQATDTADPAAPTTAPGEPATGLGAPAPAPGRAERRLGRRRELPAGGGRRAHRRADHRRRRARHRRHGHRHGQGPRARRRRQGRRLRRQVRRLPRLRLQHRDPRPSTRSRSCGTTPARWPCAPRSPRKPSKAARPSRLSGPLHFPPRARARAGRAGPLGVRPT